MFRGLGFWCLGFRVLGFRVKVWGFGFRVVLKHLFPTAEKVLP